MATSTIKPKKGTTAQWVASGRVLEVNEWGVEVTENGHHILRIGDGEHLFHELPAVFDAENYEELMAQAVDATNAANTATANADTARDNADAAAAAALTAANTASIAAQANTNAVIETASGEVVTMNDSSDLALTGLKLYGKTTQDGTPTPDAPVPLVSVGDGGTIKTTVTGKNLYGFEENTFVRHKAVYLNNPLPAGTYAVSAVCTSNDTDAETCIATFLNADNSRRKIATFSRNIRDVEIVTTDFEIAEIWFMASSGYEGSLDDTATWSKVQIERGTTATAYEPYTAQALTAQTPNGLPGIPVTSGGNYTDANGQQWVCDEVDFARGVYVQRVKRYTFGGDENWEGLDSSTRSFVLKLMPLGEGIGQCVLCDKLAFNGDVAASAINTIGIRTINSTARNAFCIYLRLPEEYTGVISTTLFKAWLAENPLDVMTALTTPIETPLSAEEIAAFKALHSNKPNTTVYNDSGAHMEVEYIADTKTYIDNKFTELQNAILSAGANI